MMAQCPECQNEVTDDFGLITCSSCGASLFIDMDGQVVSGQAADEQAVEPQVTIENEFAFDQDQPESQDILPQENVYEEVAPEISEAEPMDVAYSAELLEDQEPVLDPEVPAENFEAKPLAEQSQASVAFGEEGNEPPPPAPPPEQSFVEEMDFGEEASPETPVYESAPTTADFNDVLDFANSDASSAKDGSLRYHLTMSGIDTQDLRNAVKEALTDKRFIWDIEAMVRGIRDGVLEIDQVSAIKAFVLVTRVAHLPIQIDWRQQPINQP